VTNHPVKLPAALYRIVTVLLLLALFAQLLFSARQKSPTVDEPSHLGRGYGYLKSGDMRMSRDAGHPLLFNLLCALPLLLLRDMPSPEQLPDWHSGFRNAFAVELAFSGAVPVHRLFFLSRLPVILTTLCLVALSARWAGELYGPWGRMLTLVLHCDLQPEPRPGREEHGEHQDDEDDAGPEVGLEEREAPPGFVLGFVCRMMESHRTRSEHGSSRPSPSRNRGSHR